MKFRIEFDVAEKSCIKVLRDAGFRIEDGFVTTNGGLSGYFILLIKLDSIDDIKLLQETLHNNPYPVNNISLNFNETDEEGEPLPPSIFVNND